MKVKAEFMGGVQLSFDGKPPREIIDALKANGYRWNPRAAQWYKNKSSGAAEFIGWLRAYGEPKKPDGNCWICKSSDGYFRNRGAASPVWCDSCHGAAV